MSRLRTEIRAGTTSVGSVRRAPGADAPGRTARTAGGPAASEGSDLQCPAVPAEQLATVCRRSAGDGESALSTGGCVETSAGGADYLRIFVTRPAPTVRPPSRMAKRRPSSMAIGWIRSTVISVLSPGMTISVPSGSVTTPVTSVVRK